MFFRNKSKGIANSASWDGWKNEIIDRISKFVENFDSAQEYLQNIGDDSYAADVAECIRLLRDSASVLAEVLDFHEERKRKNFKTGVSDILDSIELFMKSDPYPHSYKGEAYPLIRKLYNLIDDASIV